MANDAEGLGVHKGIHELSTFHRSVLVVDDERHVLYIVVQGKAEGNDLNQWRKEHKK